MSYKKMKESALVLAEERIAEFNKFYNFEFGKIRVKNQKSRWGSCSKKGNLNFNYRIALLPKDVADYIIVHELCHLGELNHSKNFWNLVAKTIPNHKEIRKKLRRISMRRARKQNRPLWKSKTIWGKIALTFIS